MIYLFGKTWEHSAGNRKKVVLYWTMFIIGNALTLVIHPLVIAKMITTLQVEGVTRGNFWFIALLLFVNVMVTLVFWGFHGPARCIERANAFRVRSSYCKFLVRGVFSLPLDWHSGHHSGDTIDKIEKGRQGIYSFAADTFQPIFSGVRLIVSIVMLTIFSHSAGVIVLGMLVVTGVIVVIYDKKILANYRTLNRADNAVSASIIDAISHITTVISLRIEKRMFKRICSRIDAPYELNKETTRLNEMKWFLVALCCSVMWALVLGTYLWNCIGAVGGIVMGSVFLLIRYLDELSELFQRFTDMYSEVLQRQAKVLNAEEIAIEFKEENMVDHVLPQNWQKIDVNNLNFTYENAEGNIVHLKDVSLTVNRGERIALVGWSGSGKSTFLKVFRDLHKPETVNVSVDGVPVKDGFGGISNAIALIQQTPEIFSTTIGDNITIGEDYDPAKVQHYIDMACFTKVVDRLPRKLDSVINEKGVNLSGGERQRLALTRGLLVSEDMSLILIDEPTSSVDEASKLGIYDNIFREFEDSSIIFATHELHLLPLFDRIYMFKEGQVVGAGTLEELRENCPAFQELCSRKQEELVS
jgi:ABC-type multidrug transport system fused ATPase/permease subunit